MRYILLFFTFALLMGDEVKLEELGQGGRTLQLKEVQLPRHSKIFYVPTPGVELTLINQLRDNENQVIEMDPSQLVTRSPDVIVVPEGTSYEGKGVIVEYETPIRDVRFNTMILTHRELRRKIKAMERFHRSQADRTDFGGIIREMAHDAGGGENFTIDPRRLSRNDRIVVVAPHPDDAEIGAGGLIQRLFKRGIAVEVWNLTSGHRARMFHNGVELTDNEMKGKIRERESTNALKYLNSHVKVENLNLPFYTNGYRLSENDRQSIRKRITRDMVFVSPDPDDAHAAHRAATQLMQEVLKDFPELVHGHYCTPWTGNWNLYVYGDKGSKLAALVGSERLVGKGEQALSLNELGGDRAERYRVYKLR